MAITFLTSDGLSWSGKLFCINWQRRSTKALQLWLYAVSGSISFRMNVLSSFAVIEPREEEEDEEEWGGGLEEEEGPIFWLACGCGKEYSKKFGIADIPCLSLSCCPLCGYSLKRRSGVHVSQKKWKQVRVLSPILKYGVSIFWHLSVRPVSKYRAQHWLNT